LVQLPEHSTVDRSIMDVINRRYFLGLAGIAGLGAISGPAHAVEAAGAGIASPPTAPPPVSDEFPTQSPALSREMVGVSHGNLPRVNELLALHPTLANAAWDWGFGDWETALGAAAHMGNLEIAAALLTNGARPSIFSAAMLGQLAVVRAFLEASPGIQGTLGPHGITLLAHARAGGDAAKPVVAFLVEKGGADPVPKAVDLPPELAARFAGVYAFGARETDRVEIAIEKGGTRFKRIGTAARNLVYLGDYAFQPAGAPMVRVRFALSGDGVASELTVFDAELVLRAARVI
jgi:hypothetical protein